MRTAALRVLQLVLAGGLIALLLRAGVFKLSDLAEVGERWPWLVAAHAIFAVFLLCATLRWHLLMRARGIATRLRDTAAILLVGWLFNQTMPSSTGGDVAKAVAIALEHPEHRASAVLSIAIDRFIGLLALLTFALVTAAVNAPLVRSSALVATFVGSIALLLLGAIVTITLFYSSALRVWLAARGAALLAGRIRPGATDSLPGRIAVRAFELIVSIDQAVYAYRSRPDTLAACFGLSLALHLSTIGVNLCLTWAVLGRPFDWVALLVLIPLAHTGMAVPITPGAIGVAETLYTQLFALAGIAQGALICVLQRSIWYSWALVGALVFALRKSGRRSVLAPAPIVASAARSD